MPACILRTIRPSIKKHGLDNGASRINYKESRVRCRQRLLKLYALYFSNLSNSQWMGAHLACSFHLCRLRSTYLNRNFCANAAHQPKRLLAALTGIDLIHQNLSCSPPAAALQSYIKSRWLAWAGRAAFRSSYIKDGWIRSHRGEKSKSTKYTFDVLYKARLNMKKDTVLLRKDFFLIYVWDDLCRVFCVLKMRNGLFSVLNSTQLLCLLQS